jgi:hypothetical protein
VLIIDIEADRESAFFVEPARRRNASPLATSLTYLFSPQHRTRGGGSHVSSIAQPGDCHREGVAQTR